MSPSLHLLGNTITSSPYGPHGEHPKRWRANVTVPFPTKAPSIWAQTAFPGVFFSFLHHFRAIEVYKNCWSSCWQRVSSAVQTATDFFGRIQDGYGDVHLWNWTWLYKPSNFEIHNFDSSILFLCLAPRCCWSPRQPSAELEQFFGHAHEARESQVWQQVCPTVAGRLRVSDARQQILRDNTTTPMTTAIPMTTAPPMTTAIPMSSYIYIYYIVFTV